MFKAYQTPFAVVAQSYNNLRAETYKGGFTKGEILTELKRLLSRRPPEVNTIAELDEV